VRSFSSIFLATTLTALCAAPAFALPAPGSTITGSLATPVDTRTGYVGEPVELTHLNSGDPSIQGGRLYGTVTNVVHAGQGRPAEMQLTFNRLVLPSGSSYAVDGVVTQMNATTKSNALKEAGGALAGMLVGNAIGKTLFAASGGGIVGAAGGFLIAKNNRQDMALSQGSSVTVRLVSARRQSHY